MRTFIGKDAKGVRAYAQVGILGLLAAWLVSGHGPLLPSAAVVTLT